MALLDNIRAMLHALRNDNGNPLFDNETINTAINNLNILGYREINPLIEFALGNLANPHQNQNQRWENIEVDAYVGEQIYNYLINLD